MATVGTEKGHKWKTWFLVILVFFIFFPLGFCEDFLLGQMLQSSRTSIQAQQSPSQLYALRYQFGNVLWDLLNEFIFVECECIRSTRSRCVECGRNIFTSISVECNGQLITCNDKCERSCWMWYISSLRCLLNMINYKYWMWILMLNIYTYI